MTDNTHPLYRSNSTNITIYKTKDKAAQPDSTKPIKPQSFFTWILGKETYANIRYICIFAPKAFLKKLMETAAGMGKSDIIILLEKFWGK